MQTNQTDWGKNSMNDNSGNNVTKKAIRLDDGRQLIYYNFSQTKQGPSSTAIKPIKTKPEEK